MQDGRRHFNSPKLYQSHNANLLILIGPWLVIMFRVLGLHPHFLVTVVSLLVSLVLYYYSTVASIPLAPCDQR